MKKLLSTLLISTAVFGGAQIVAAQDVIGAGEADIAVNGTLGPTIQTLVQQSLKVIQTGLTLLYQQKLFSTIKLLMQQSKRQHMTLQTTQVVLSLSA